MECASNGKGNLGVTLGAIGTGLGLLDGGLGLMASGSHAANYVTKGELRMIQELADKDSKIAQLQAENVSETKMIEVYKQVHSEIASLRDKVDDDLKDLRKEVNQNRREQDAWNASQSVVNTQMSAAIATNVNSINAINEILGKITQIKIPNTAVCPGWGPVTITPGSGGTTIV